MTDTEKEEYNQLITERDALLSKMDGIAARSNQLRNMGLLNKALELSAQWELKKARYEIVHDRLYELFNKQRKG